MNNTYLTGAIVIVIVSCVSAWIGIGIVTSWSLPDELAGATVCEIAAEAARSQANKRRFMPLPRDHHRWFAPSSAPMMAADEQTRELALAFWQAGRIPFGLDRPDNIDNAFDALLMHCNAIGEIAR